MNAPVPGVPPRGSESPNFDARELAKFGALAHRWWDPASEFRPLHEINPLRLGHIARSTSAAAAAYSPRRWREPARK